MKKLSLLIGIIMVMIFTNCKKETIEPCNCTNTTDTVYINTIDTTVINGDTVYVTTIDTVIITVTDTVYVNDVKPSLYGLWQIWSVTGNAGYDYKVLITTEQWKLDYNNDNNWDYVYNIEVGPNEEWLKQLDVNTNDEIAFYTVTFDEETGGLKMTDENGNVNRYKRYE